MKILKRLAQQIEAKSKKELFKFSLVIFFASLLIGFSTGLIFREIRLNRLLTKKRTQTIEENRQLHSLFQEVRDQKSLLAK